MAASRRQANNAPPAFATMASEGGGRAQAVGGYRKFGLTKLRLKGASEIADAAAKLQQWQAQLQEQEQALEHYRAVVARREQSLLVSEAVLPARDTVGEAAVEPELGGVVSTTPYHTTPHYTMSHHTTLYHSISHHMLPGCLGAGPTGDAPGREVEGARPVGLHHYSPVEGLHPAYVLVPQ